jgi:hypothetical protein
MPDTLRPHTGFSPLTREVLERPLAPDVRDAVRAGSGPATPLFGRPAAAVRAAFERFGLLHPAWSVYVSEAGGALAVVEVFAPFGERETTSLRVAVTVPDRAGGGPEPEDADLLARAVRFVFATTTALRVDAVAPADDAARRDACERAGLAFEGVLRAAAVRCGAPVDLAVFAAVRGRTPPGTPPSARRPR